MPDPAPRPRPLPGHAAVPEARKTSRRWFLAGGGAVLLGGGAGVVAGLLHHTPTRPPAAPPAALVAAVDAERTLIADLVATTGGAPAIRRVIAAAHTDHVAHLQALETLVATYRAPAPSASASTPARRGTPRTRAQLRTAEQRAAAAAARRADSLDGAHAALLASISACEATHADLLT